MHNLQGFSARRVSNALKITLHLHPVREPLLFVLSVSRHGLTRVTFMLLYYTTLRRCFRCFSDLSDTAYFTVLSVNV